MPIRFSLMAISLLSLIVLPFIASAATAEDDEGGMVIEEIIVTAEKREQNLQTTAISITAYTVGMLDDLRIQTVEELADFAPNVTMRPSDRAGGLGGPIYIRGVGQDNIASFLDPGVGLHVDGVYIARIQGAFFDMMDVERVEVLRGPQGTLFGRNSVGGSIRIITAKPTEEKEYLVSGEYGNYNRARLRGMVSGPLSDKVLARVSVLSDQRDGFMERVLGGKATNNKDVQSLRLAFRFLPSDSVTIDLAADYTKVRQNGLTNRLISFDPEARFAGPLQRFIGDLSPYVWDRSLDPYKGAGTGVDFNKENLDLGSVTGTVTWEFPQWGTFKSITGYREFDQSSRRDSDGTPLEVLDTGLDYDQWQISQEFQFFGNAMDDRLTWLVGVYGFHEEAFQDWNVRNFQLINTGAQEVPPESLEFAFMANRPFGEVATRETNNDAYAIFSQVTYAATDRLNVTAGLRYSYEKKWADLLTGRLPEPDSDGFVFFAGQDQLTFSDLSPKLSADFQFTDDIFAYGTISRAFKAGAIQGIAFREENFIPTDEEIVWNYELGFKTRWAENRLQINGAVFYMDYTDIQVPVFATNTNGVQVRRTANAAAATISGMELELVAVPVEGLTLRASVGLLDPKFDDFIDPDPRVPPPGIDRTGSAFPNAPKKNYSLSSLYVVPLQNGSELAFSGNYSWRSKTWNSLQDPFNPGPRDTGFEPSYGLLGGRITWTTLDGRLDFTLWGENLTDEAYITSVTSLNVPFGMVMGTFGPPRTYGATVTFRN